MTKEKKKKKKERKKKVTTRVSLSRAKKEKKKATNFYMFAQILNFKSAYFISNLGVSMYSKRVERVLN